MRSSLTDPCHSCVGYCEHEYCGRNAVLISWQTCAVLGVFVLALLLHPEVFAKAREEIDNRTGKERLVDFDDRDSLPYFECVLREVLR